MRGDTPAALLAALATGLVFTGLAIAGTHPIQPPATPSQPDAPSLDLGVHGSPFATAIPPRAGHAAEGSRELRPRLLRRSRRAALRGGLGRALAGRADGLRGFDHWRAGYAGTNPSSRPQDIVVKTGAGSASVRHVLIAHHRDCAGEQRFTVTWNLERVSGNWRATALRGTALNTPPCG